MVGGGLLTGTISRVDKKLQMYDTRYGSELFCLPSTSNVLGTSGMRLKAAFRHASAELKKIGN